MVGRTRQCLCADPTLSATTSADRVSMSCCSIEILFATNDEKMQSGGAVPLCDPGLGNWSSFTLVTRALFISEWLLKDSHCHCCFTKTLPHHLHWQRLRAIASTAFELAQTRALTSLCNVVKNHSFDMTQRFQRSTTYTPYYNTHYYLYIMFHNMWVCTTQVFTLDLRHNVEAFLHPS